MSSFSMDEGSPTEFWISTLDRKPITFYAITPRKLPINARAEGNQAHYLIVKINDKKQSVILADPSEKGATNPAGKGFYNVLDYGADNTGGSVTKGI
ncbi:hypothetical protein DL765_007526 [Monosporascus sp. GIB2]|nr:hypothetical protein DL765_007526 [Monosporascus sp. GIB2]